MSVPAPKPEARRVRYGFIERVYDTDRMTTRLVKRRYVTWRENGEKMGRWDFVPAETPETDAEPWQSAILGARVSS